MTSVNHPNINSNKKSDIVPGGGYHRRSKTDGNVNNLLLKPTKSQLQEHENMMAMKN